MTTDGLWRWTISVGITSRRWGVLAACGLRTSAATLLACPRQPRYNPLGSSCWRSPALPPCSRRWRIPLERVPRPPDPLPDQVEFDLGDLEEREHAMAFLARHLGGDGLIDIGYAIRIVVIGKQRLVAPHGVANFAQRVLRLLGRIGVAGGRIGVLLGIDLGEPAHEAFMEWQAVGPGRVGVLLGRQFACRLGEIGIDLADLGCRQEPGT